MTYSPPNQDNVDGRINDHDPPDISNIDVQLADIPETPTNLTATENGGNVDLSWDENATIDDGYYVYRATSSGNSTGDYTKIATLSANKSSYTDTGVKDGEAYYYRVTAYTN